MQPLIKLNHQLISLKDLHKSSEFARRLLEWFNFPSPSNVTLVLSIILKSFKSYPKIYIDLGLVDFLSGLRRDVTEDEQVVVDTILQEIDFIAKKSEENFENSTTSFEVSF